MKDLYEKMCSYSDDHVYSMRTFRDRLMKYYSDEIYFEKGGKGEFVVFKNMTKFYLDSLKHRDKSSVISVAAKLIKDDIRKMQKSTNFYPTEQDILNGEEWMPDSLNLFLSSLVPCKTKRVALGQSLVQAARPRSIISPIPFALGTHVDKSSASKSLLRTLSKLGFTITNDEVVRFKQSSVVQHENEQAANNNTEGSESFTQFVGDNIDHNQLTLTGKNTLHAMGLIKITNNSSNAIRNPIPRLKERLTAELLVKNKGIEIIPYNIAEHEAPLFLEPMSVVIEQLPKVPDPNMNCDLLWHYSWAFASDNKPRPNWSGFMQACTFGSDHPSKSRIDFLPIIDHNPNDVSCIYTTLIYVQKQAAKLRLPTPVITFDQPLWLKAMKIIKAEKLSIVCRLGGFHLLMSFVGSIGHLMRGSGLEQLFEQVYGTNSVDQIMSGKFIVRALRAHFMAESALKTLLIESAKEKFAFDSSDLERFYERALAQKLDADSITEMVASDAYKQLSSSLQQLQLSLKADSRTAKLWLLYLDSIELVKLFIFAERTSNWPLHLHVTSKMLNLFAATGHGNYAKSARLYLQEMSQLEHKYPWVFNNFMKGYHTVARSSHDLIWR